MQEVNRPKAWAKKPGPKNAWESTAHDLQFAVATGDDEDKGSPSRDGANPACW